MEDAAQDPEVALAQVTRLINELLRGTLNRNCFRAWEIELLLEIEGCNFGPSARRDVLRRYQKAVRRHFEKGETRRLKLSEFLEAQRSRKIRRGGSGPESALS